MISFGKLLWDRRRTFIAQHQSYGQQSILASTSAFNCWIAGLQTVYKEKCQYYDIFGDLGGRQNCNNPFPEPARRKCLFLQLLDCSRGW